MSLLLLYPVCWLMHCDMISESFSESSSIDVTIVCTVAVNLIFSGHSVHTLMSFAFIVCRYHAHLRGTDCVVCIAADSEYSGEKLYKHKCGSHNGAVHVLYHQFCHDGMFPHCCEDLLRSVEFDGSRSANVFIYGAKEAGVNIAKALRVSLRNHYRLRGFIADEPELINKVMMGLRFP